MTDKDRKIIETCGEMLPRLSESEKEGFLRFTEGMAFLSDRRDRSTRTADTGPQRVQG